MKKAQKKTKGTTAKKTTRAAAKKSAVKKPGSAKPASAPRPGAGRYTPTAIKGIGWKPFRYPPA